VISAGGNWFADELIRRIKADQEDKSMGLGRGDAGDFADYRYGVGFIAGQECALDFIEQILKEQEKA
jgi:hypothetical protein